MRGGRHFSAGRARQLALLLLLTFVGGELLALAHRAQAAHATCAEHGEAIHVADMGDAAAVQPVGAAVAAAREAGLQSARAAAEVEHDHCRLCTLATGTVARGPEPPTGPRLEGRSASLARSQATLGAARLYALAPKTSPPSITVPVEI